MSGLTMPHAAQRRVLVAVRGRLGGPASFVGIAAAVGAIAAANGGFFPSSWGWAALGFSWVALLTLLLARDVALDRLRVAFAGALTALAAWVWLSGVWTPDLGATIFEGERMLVYVTGLLAVLLLVRRTQVATLLGGLLAAATVVGAYSLATRLFPGRIGSFNALAVYRLAEPLGYWNALGILCVFGVLLALGLATFSTRALARASAGSSLPVLLATLYFTYSRGSWIALAVGFMVAVAVSPARLRLITGALVLAAAPALVVLESSRSDALTHSGARLAAASHEGHRLALIVLLAAAVEAGVAVAVGIASERLNVGRSVRLAYGSALVLACLVAFAGIWIAEGSPYAIAKRGYHAFATRPPSTPDNLNQRLLNFSGNGRTDLWQVAWQEAQAHPALGGGAGSYEGYWLQHRTSELHVVDAHNLYLETLAELGPVGLALLALALGIPLAAAIRARRHPLVAAAVGVYAAFLVHAIVDWDWEVPAVTLTALFAGAAIVIAAPGEETKPAPLAPRVRIGLAMAVAAVSIIAFVALVGNMALSRSEHAAARGNWAASAKQAKRATHWLPWSAEPWRLLGEAQMVRHEDARPALRTAIGKDDGNWLLWFDLAAASKGPAAQQALARAKALNPLSPEIAGLGGAG